MDFEERITTGLSIKQLQPLRDQILINTNEVRNLLGIVSTGEYYEGRIKHLVRAACLEFERYTGILLHPRSVKVGWSALYDYERLPFGPSNIAVGQSLVMVDKNQVAIEMGCVKIVDDTEGFQRIVGDFKDGIYFNYTAGLVIVPEGNVNGFPKFSDYGDYGSRILSAVMDLFNEELPLKEIAKTHFQL